MLQLPHKIKIIYASTSGNVEATCEYIAELLEGHHFEVDLFRSEKCDAVELINNHLFIFATSTWEHGEINPYFEPILKDFEGLDLHNKFAGFIGLGDKRYEPVLFCKGVETARDEFISHGGTEIGEMLKINGHPYSQFKDLVKPWTLKFISDLINHDSFELVE